MIARFVWWLMEWLRGYYLSSHGGEDPEVDPAVVAEMDAINCRRFPDLFEKESVQ